MTPESRKIGAGIDVHYQATTRRTGTAEMNTHAKTEELSFLCNYEVNTPF
jgi:hypothetical protein